MRINNYNKLSIQHKYLKDILDNSNIKLEDINYNDVFFDEKSQLFKKEETIIEISNGNFSSSIVYVVFDINNILLNKYFMDNIKNPNYRYKIIYDIDEYKIIKDGNTNGNAFIKKINE